MSAIEKIISLDPYLAHPELEVRDITLSQSTKENPSKEMNQLAMMLARKAKMNNFDKRRFLSSLEYVFDNV